MLFSFKQPCNPCLFRVWRGRIFIVLFNLRPLCIKRDAFCNLWVEIKFRGQGSVTEPAVKCKPVLVGRIGLFCFFTAFNALAFNLAAVGIEIDSVYRSRRSSAAWAASAAALPVNGDGSRKCAAALIVFAALAFKTAVAYCNGVCTCCFCDIRKRDIGIIRIFNRNGSGFEWKLFISEHAAYFIQSVLA